MHTKKSRNIKGFLNKFTARFTAQTLRKNGKTRVKKREKTQKKRQKSYDFCRFGGKPESHFELFVDYNKIILALNLKI